MKSVALLLSSLLLVACGGGGGGGSSGVPAPTGPVASTSTFQVKQAYINDFLRTGSASVKISGIANVNPGTASAQKVEVTGNGTESVGSRTAATFEGQAALMKVTIFSGTVTGTSVTGGTLTLPLNSTSSSFVKNDGTYDPLGFDSGSSYSVLSGSFGLPKTAKVGDSGVLGNVNSFTNSTKTVPNGSYSSRWTLEADTVNTAILSSIQTSLDTVGRVNGVAKSVARITPDGTMTRLFDTSEFFDTAGNVISTVTFIY